jgi:hypothetical protein
MAPLRKLGTARVARVLGVSREALLVYAGDYSRQAGTDALIEGRADRLVEIGEFPIASPTGSRIGD